MKQKFIFKKHIAILCMVLCFWVIYTVSYLLLKKTNATLLTGILVFAGEVVLDIVVALLACFAWKRANSKIKLFFFLFFLSFIFASLSDAIYNYLLNIKQVEITAFLDSLFDVPFAIFLFLQMIAWAILFVRFGYQKHEKIISYVPYILAAFLIFMTFIFGASWKIGYLSTIGIYQIIDTLLEAIGFLFAAFCLVRAKEVWLKYLSIGYLAIISSDFIIRYNVIEKHTIQYSPLETTWILGLALIIIGFFLSRKKIDNNILTHANSLQSQVSVWLFSSCLITVFLFSVILHIISSLSGYPEFININNFPSIIIVFFILSALISNFVALIIAGPFKEVQKIIESFNLDSDEIENIDINTHIQELNELELFMINSLKLKNEKYIIEKNLARLSRQVAHDTISPLLTIELILKDVDIEEDKRKLIKTSILRIKEISAQILDEYKAHKFSQIEFRKDALKSTALFPIVEDIVNEKIVKLQALNIDFDTIIDPQDKTVCAVINPASFKRVLSNLINNAIDAVVNTDEKHIRLSITTSSDYVSVEIADNGCGISPQLLNKIFDEGFTYGKENGTGIGLHFVETCIKLWHGKCDVQSKFGNGTTFKFNLPISGQ